MKLPLVKRTAVRLSRKTECPVAAVVWTVLMFCPHSDVITGRACFVLFHCGHGAALTTAGILQNYLCPTGEHQGLAGTARPAPSNNRASWEHQASSCLSKVKFNPNQMAEDTVRAGQGLQDSLLRARCLAQDLALSGHAERGCAVNQAVRGSVGSKEGI